MVELVFYFFQELLVKNRYATLLSFISFSAVCGGGPAPADITRAKLRELAARPFTKFLGELDTNLTIFRGVPKGAEETFLKPFGATPDHVRFVRPFFADGSKPKRIEELRRQAPACARSVKGNGCGECAACQQCEESAAHIRAIFERMRIKQGKEVELRVAIREAAHDENTEAMGMVDYSLASLKKILDQQDPMGNLYFRLVARGIFTEHVLLSLLKKK